MKAEVFISKISKVDSRRLNRTQMNKFVNWTSLWWLLTQDCLVIKHDLWVHCVSLLGFMSQNSAPGENVTHINQ